MRVENSACRDDEDADGGDDEKVESSGSHDETWPQLVLLEAVEENTNDGEQYFRGRSRTCQKINRIIIPDFMVGVASSLIVRTSSRHSKCPQYGRHFVPFTVSLFYGKRIGGFHT